MTYKPLFIYKYVRFVSTIFIFFDCLIGAVVSQQPVIGVDHLITLRLIYCHLALAMTLCAGVDQYLAIVEPLHYHALVTKPRLAAVCALVWVLGCLAAAVSC